MGNNSSVSKDHRNSLLGKINVIEYPTFEQSTAPTIGHDEEAEEEDKSSDSINEIQEWLINLQLTQYQNNFIKNGFENMTFIKDVINNKHILHEIGISLIGHQLVILNDIDRLRDNTQHSLSTLTTKSQCNSSSPSNEMVSSLSGSDTATSNNYNKSNLSYSCNNTVNESDDHEIGIIFEFDEEEKLNNTQYIICHNKFEQWLSNVVRLSQYLSLFRGIRYDDIRKINAFDDNLLQRMGINNKIHRQKVLYESNIYRKLQLSFSQFLNHSETLKTFKSQFDRNGILTQRELQKDVENERDLAHILCINDESKINEIWDEMEPLFSTHIYNHKNEYYHNDIQCNELITKLMDNGKLRIVPIHKIKSYKNKLEEQKHCTFCMIIPNAITIPHSAWDFTFALYIPYKSRTNHEKQTFVYSTFSASYQKLKKIDNIINKHISNGYKYFAATNQKFPSLNEIKCGHKREEAKRKRGDIIDKAMEIEETFIVKPQLPSNKKLKLFKMNATVDDLINISKYLNRLFSSPSLLKESYLYEMLGFDPEIQQLLQLLAAIKYEALYTISEQKQYERNPHKLQCMGSQYVFHTAYIVSRSIKNHRLFTPNRWAIKLEGHEYLLTAEFFPGNNQYGIVRTQILLNTSMNRRIFWYYWQNEGTARDDMEILPYFTNRWNILETIYVGHIEVALIAHLICKWLSVNNNIYYKQQNNSQDFVRDLTALLDIDIAKKLNKMMDITHILPIGGIGENIISKQLRMYSIRDILDDVVKRYHDRRQTMQEEQQRNAGNEFKENWRKCSEYVLAANCDSFLSEEESEDKEDKEYMIKITPWIDSDDTENEEDDDDGMDKQRMMDIDIVMDERMYNEMMNKLKTDSFKMDICTGHCGSSFSCLIEYCKTSVIDQMDGWKDVIRDGFEKYGVPVRMALIEAMKLKGIDSIYYGILNKLVDVEYCINSDDRIEEISDLLTELANNGYLDILQKLENIACIEKERNLIEEIIENYCNKCNGDRYEQKKIKNGKMESNENDDDDERDRNNDKGEEEKKECNDRDNGDGDKNGNNNNNNNDDLECDEKMKYYLQRLLQVQKHGNYRKMIEKGYKLSDYELISIIYYCDNGAYCRKMKGYHLRFEMQCKWRNLYYHLTHGIDKLHKCFHLKNKEREYYIRTLFHGSSCHALDVWSLDQLFLKTITSFTYDFGVARSFAQSTIKGDGLIFAIYNAGRSIYSGILRAADVSWISIHEEKEYIVLPTTFHQFEKLTEEIAKQKGWIAWPQKNAIYVTKRYKSNKDILCPYTDNISKKIKPSYDNVPNVFHHRMMSLFHDIIQNEEQSNDCIVLQKGYIDRRLNILDNNNNNKYILLLRSRMFGRNDKYIKEREIDDVWKMIFILFEKLNDLNVNIKYNEKLIHWMLCNADLKGIKLNGSRNEYININKSYWMTDLIK